MQSDSALPHISVAALSAFLVSYDDSLALFIISLQNYDFRKIILPVYNSAFIEGINERTC